MYHGLLASIPCYHDGMATNRSAGHATALIRQIYNNVLGWAEKFLQTILSLQVHNQPFRRVVAPHYSTMITQLTELTVLFSIAELLLLCDVTSPLGVTMEENILGKGCLRERGELASIEKLVQAVYLLPNS